MGNYWFNFNSLFYFFLSIGYFTNNTWLYLNTGLSSSVNWDRKLLTEEADIVTAHGTKCSLILHELLRNWFMLIMFSYQFTDVHRSLESMRET